MMFGDKILEGYIIKGVYDRAANTTSIEYSYRVGRTCNIHIYRTKLLKRLVSIHYKDKKAFRLENIKGIHKFELENIKHISITTLHYIYIFKKI